MFQSLKPFRKEVVVDEPRKDSVTAMNFFSCYNKYQHKKPLKDLGVLGMTVEKFWEGSDKDYMEFEYEKPLDTKQAHTKLSWTMKRLHEWYYGIILHVYVACNLSNVVFLKRFSRVKVLI
jgi:hypothetical protein